MCKSSRRIDLLFLHMNINDIFAGFNVPDSLDLVNDIKFAFLVCYIMQLYIVTIGKSAKKYFK